MGASVECLIWSLFVLNGLEFSLTVNWLISVKIKEFAGAGSLRCLNGKVDLSTFEAINTLDEWETKFNSMYEESSVRAIAKQISAAEQPRAVKIYAYRNGEGRQKEGQLIIGSSIIGVSDSTLRTSSHALPVFSVKPVIFFQVQIPFRSSKYMTLSSCVL